MKERPQILILDDDPTDAFLLRRSLGKQILNGTYVLAEDRTQYLDALENHDIDVIVSDSSILALTALEAFRLAKARRSDTAFFIFSGSVRPELAERAAEIGVTASIEKHQMDELVRQIIRVLD